ncbi:hypothetical protein [Sinorhizobium prairiense]|nr:MULTISPECIES: hypothetical protein [unclassified Sinorhizobium]WEJ08593.1 hypothetical protein N0Q90_00145 [Sinorhizobium sp. M103]WEJ13904.1 hypothetical protein N0Q91_02520 [Sinorhizobium sp. K101]WEJ35504.1 hypothetical protein N0R80_02550 [Sinorhizobium sp. C101]
MYFKAEGVSNAAGICLLDVEYGVWVYREGDDLRRGREPQS